MCLFNILQTIQKLKAAVTVLADSHSKDKVSEIKNLYFQKATVLLDEDEGKDQDEIKDTFMTFLD